jgi:tocopherol cyclase
MMRFVRQVLHPAWYHGHDKRPPFFEGWYFKLVDASGQHRYAIIPGIFKSDDPAQHHAFVQVLNGTTGHVVYHRFPADAFHAAHDRLDVRIGASRFTDRSLSVHVDAPGQMLDGEVVFEGITPWPVTLISPGIMGWYSWVPTMECYHGVLSLDHVLSGAFVVDGRTIDWSGGRGYIEKDWGASFPSAWIWLQTNHFAPATSVAAQGTLLTASVASLTASVAIIPWRRSSFRGMIVGLWHGGRLYRFATYTGAKTERLEVSDERVTWVLRGRPFVGGPAHRLELRAMRAEGGLIRGPSTIEMGVRVAESLSASVEVRLTRLRGGQATLIFKGTGRYAGLEIMGDLERLLEA